jgi:hypothetical protein
MGSVLSFAPRNAATKPKTAVAGTTGSVIIFPGVRYEHPNAAGGVRIVRPVAVADPRQEKPLPHC